MENIADINIKQSYDALFSFYYNEGIQQRDKHRRVSVSPVTWPEWQAVPTVVSPTHTHPISTRTGHQNGINYGTVHKDNLHENNYLYLGDFNYSKSSQRAMDELQRTIIEIETKYKAELSRLKKKYEVELREYEMQIETLTRSNNELAKSNKSLSARVKVCKKL